MIFESGKAGVQTGVDLQPQLRQASRLGEWELHTSPGDALHNLYKPLKS
jgi:hypothetical protein